MLRALRSRLLEHNGKVTLLERGQKEDAERVTAVVSGFCHQIRDATDPVLYAALVCDSPLRHPMRESLVAEAVALSVAHLQKVAQRLSAHGYIETVRGRA